MKYKFGRGVLMRSLRFDFDNNDVLSRFLNGILKNPLHLRFMVRPIDGSTRGFRFEFDDVEILKRFLDLVFMIPNMSGVTMMILDNLSPDDVKAEPLPEAPVKEPEVSGSLGVMRSGDVDRALNSFEEELLRAESKFPSFPIDPVHAAAVVVEEAGELQQAALQATYENGFMEAMVKEATHVGAMALRFLLNVDAMRCRVSDQIKRTGSIAARKGDPTSKMCPPCKDSSACPGNKMVAPCQGCTCKAVVRTDPKQRTDLHQDCDKCPVGDELCNKYHDCVLDVFQAGLKKGAEEELLESVKRADHMRVDPQDI